jgi:hypothetical protein
LLESINWDINVSNFENGSCTNSIVHCRHISDCLLCINDAAIDHLVALFYGGFTPTTNSLIRKCQVGLGKEASKFFQTKGKIRGKCEDLVLKGAITPPCPNEKADLAITKAKAIAKMCAACGGPDHVCGTDDDPTSPAPASSRCPPIDPPGSPAPAAGDRRSRTRQCGDASRASRRLPRRGAPAATRAADATPTSRRRSRP